jgi:hypothetical protein
VPVSQRPPALQPKPVTNPAGFDARELFRALANHDVEYVTIGGIAIQAYGGQRLTQDLDVAIAGSTDNVARLASALLDLDARILGPDGQRIGQAEVHRLVPIGYSDGLVNRRRPPFDLVRAPLKKALREVRHPGRR